MALTGGESLNKLALTICFVSLFGMTSPLTRVADEMDRSCSGLNGKKQSLDCYKKFEKKFESKLIRELEELEKDPAFSDEELAKIKRKIKKRIKSRL